MAYLPKNKYEIRYTNGKEYRLESTNKPHIGDYILTSDRKIYAGNSPESHIGKLLPIKTRPYKNINNIPLNNRIYSILQPKLTDKQNSHIPVNSSSPTPTVVDYSKGYFRRYLAVKLNTKSYTEISRKTFEEFKTHNYNDDLYKVFSLLWSLKEDNEGDNIKTLRNLEVKLPGITDAFPFKNQYSLKRGIINISNTSRIYPTGDVVAKSLPAAYQLGNSQINSIDNPNVPNNQYCGNCIFNQNNFCNKWNATIKAKYWCRAYQVQVDSEE